MKTAKGSGMRELGLKNGLSIALGKKAVYFVNRMSEYKYEDNDRFSQDVLYLKCWKEHNEILYAVLIFAMKSDYYLTLYLISLSTLFREV